MSQTFAAEPEISARSEQETYSPRGICQQSSTNLGLKAPNPPLQLETRPPCPQTNETYVKLKEFISESDRLGF